MELCFTINGERVCVRVPILIEDHWWDPNPPDPRLNLDRLQDWITIGQATGPSPDPWKSDVAILATVDALIRGVSNERVREQIAKTVLQSSSDLSRTLPADVQMQLSASTTLSS